MSDLQQTQTAARVVATPRQMRDRLDTLAASLRAGVQAVGLRERTAREALELAESLAVQEELALALRALGECHLEAGNPDEARVVLRDAARVYEDLGDAGHVAGTLLLLARAFLASHGVPEAHGALTRARDIYQKLGDERGLAAADTALGNLYAGAGDLVRAVECFTGALVTLEGLAEQRAESDDVRADVTAEVSADVPADGADVLRLGVVLNDLAHAHSALGDDARAIELMARALALFEHAGDLNSLAKALAAMGALEAAAYTMPDAAPDAGLEKSMRAALLFDTLHDEPGTARTLMTVATIHERSGRPAEALGTMEKALAKSERAGDGPLLASALIGMARLQRSMGSPWKSAAHLTRAIEILNRHGDRRLEYRAHELLAAVYEDLGAADKALEHYKMYMALHDAMRGEEQQRAIAELEVRFALAGAERDRELYRLQAERLRGELAGKSRELASVTSGILQKNSALGQVIDTMRARFADRRETREVLAALREEVDRLRDPGDAWAAFEAGLGAPHAAFLETLAGRYPDLSPTETKLCVLLRADLATRDIAALLYVSERTVENHRYRLRKKLNLPASANLNALLKSF